jgi:poly(ADP-ribose) glycohydrolase
MEAARATYWGVSIETILATSRYRVNDNLRNGEIVNHMKVLKNPQISPSPNHAILFEWPLSPNDNFPKPRRGRDIWSPQFVRMPCSPQSFYDAIGPNNQRTQKLRWDLIRESFLQREIEKPEHLENAIKNYNTKYADHWNFQGLHRLIDGFNASERDGFFKKLLPFIISIALELPKFIPSPIPMLKKGESKSITMSQQQACCLLANAFLCTFPRRNTDRRDSEYGSYPSINFFKLFGSTEPFAIEKLKCIINYFIRCQKNMPNGVITFERKQVDPPFSWQNSRNLLSAIKFHVTAEGKIEEAAEMSQVDFANKKVGGGVLGRGCVQEEIRFVTCPEMIVARLFTQELDDNEALIMIGCERFSLYRGYASSFEFYGEYQDDTPSDRSTRKLSTVIAIDASKYDSNFLQQFQERSFKRDLSKAYAGFFMGQQQKSAIATGLWGCGAFNGNAIRSAIIQFMACAEAHRDLVFFTNGDERIRDEIGQMFDKMSKENMTVGDAYRMLQVNSNTANPENFSSFREKVGKHGNYSSCCKIC